MALILLADDDDLVGEVVREALRARGHVVGFVEDGLTALQVVELKRPNLVILDCTMPGLNGVDVLRNIRLSKTAYATPVLMLTARRHEADVEIAMRAGADDYLKKPFDPDELVVRVESLLEKAAARGK